MTEYKDDSRCYTWTIFQLSPIQQGIQAGHAAVELFVKYVGGSSLNQHLAVERWAKANKTMVCLNGGDVAALREFIEFLEMPENPFPFAPFIESDDFLAGITTSVAVILPAHFYECAKILRTARPGGPYSYDQKAGLHRFYYELNGQMVLSEFTEWEFGLMQKMNASPLAR